MKIEEQADIYNCVLIPDGYWNGFKKMASIMVSRLDINFNDKVNDLDSFYWRFDFKGVEFNLHYHEQIGDVELFTSKHELNRSRLKMLLKGIQKHID